MRAWNRGLLLGASSIVVLAGCQGLTPEEESRVFTLMECEECTSGELDSVLAVGRKAVPLLRDLLRDGPPVQRRAITHEHLTTAWQRSREYGLVHGYIDSVLTESLYVQTYFDNYVATYQARAAGALGRLGGQEAREALLDTTVVPVRPAVSLAIQYALDSLWGP